MDLIIFRPVLRKPTILLRILHGLLHLNDREHFKKKLGYLNKQYMLKRKFKIYRVALIKYIYSYKKARKYLSLQHISISNFQESNLYEQNLSHRSQQTNLQTLYQNSLLVSFILKLFTQHPTLTHDVIIVGIYERKHDLSEVKYLHNLCYAFV